MLALPRICPSTLAIINKFDKHNICSGDFRAASSLIDPSACGCGMHTFPVIEQPVDDDPDADPVRGLLCSSHSPILPLVHSAAEHQAGDQLRSSFGPPHSDPSQIRASNMRGACSAFRLQLPFLSSSRSWTHLCGSPCFSDLGRRCTGRPGPWAALHFRAVCSGVLSALHRHPRQPVLYR